VNPHRTEQNRTEDTAQCT